MRKELDATSDYHVAQEKPFHTSIWGIPLSFLYCDRGAQKKYHGMVGCLVVYHQQSEKEIRNVFAFSS